jgi:sterol desaturase/sphingolipid hydroxylase (fatty acid hydroxylase superfamily)
MAHLGFELFPRWWVRAPILRWSNTATFHSLHHQRYTGNFGLFTRFWDRLFGTELDDYESAFVAAHAETTPDPARTAAPPTSHPS